jgi:hypothetical protein
MRWMVLSLLIAACGPHTPPKIEQHVPADAAPPLPADCPASYAAASTAGACDQSTAPSCTYPEGTCMCSTPPRCSGMPPPRDQPPEPTSWICAEKVPDVRPDGCPGPEPSGACEHDGQTCMYGSCCVTRFTCSDGQWQQGMSECPP